MSPFRLVAGGGRPQARQTLVRMRDLLLVRGRSGPAEAVEEPAEGLDVFLGGRVLSRPSWCSGLPAGWSAAMVGRASDARPLIIYSLVAPIVVVRHRGPALAGRP
jgi:hypothetical protein